MQKKVTSFINLTLQLHKKSMNNAMATSAREGCIFLLLENRCWYPVAMTAEDATVHVHHP